MGTRIEQDIHLNTDGSGKVELKMFIQAPGAPAEPEEIERGLKECMKEEVLKAAGVDTWGDLSCTFDDGTVKFSGTAYFKNLAELRLNTTGFHIGPLSLKHETLGDGSFVVSSIAGSIVEKPPPLSDAEIQAQLEENRGKLAMMRGFLGGMFSGLSCRAKILMPGKIATIKGAKKKGADGAEVGVDGDEILALLDKVVADDKLLTKIIKDGGPDSLQDQIQGPIEIVAKKPVKDRFDYETEAAAARETFSPMADQFQAEGVSPFSGGGGGPSLTPGEPLSDTRVIAIKVVSGADGDRDITPMGQNYNGVSMCIAGDLAGRVVSLSEGRIKKAITDAGDNLIPDDDWKQRISFPKLSKDGRTAFFDFDMAMPGEARGFSEISGTLTVVIAEGEEDINLGFKKLEPGAEGKKMGAVIERIEPNGDETYLDLRFACNKDLIAEFLVHTKSGDALTVRSCGYSSGGDQCQMNYSVQGEVPADGSISIKTFKDIKTVEVAWSVGGVDLLGRPM